MPNISIHALLAESDDNGYDGLSQVTVFLSTLSLRRATGILTWGNCFALISIHALLAESDQYWATRARAAQLFLSTLSLRRATHRTGRAAIISEFLSTLSLRRATCAPERAEKGITISIHALLAESDPKGVIAHSATGDISIHALLAESDRVQEGQLIGYSGFLSTLSLRRATETV